MDASLRQETSYNYFIQAFICEAICIMCKSKHEHEQTLIVAPLLGITYLQLFPSISQYISFVSVCFKSEPQNWINFMVVSAKQYAIFYLMVHTPNCKILKCQILVTKWLVFILKHPDEIPHDQSFDIRILRTTEKESVRINVWEILIVVQNRKNPETSKACYVEGPNQSWVPQLWKPLLHSSTCKKVFKRKILNFFCCLLPLVLPLYLG